MVSWCVGVLCTCMFFVIMDVVCGGVGGTRAVARAAKTVGGRRRNKATTPAARWRRDGGRLELHFPILGGSGCNCNFPRHPFCCAVRLEIRKHPDVYNPVLIPDGVESSVLASHLPALASRPCPFRPKLGFSHLRPLALAVSPIRPACKPVARITAPPLLPAKHHRPVQQVLFSCPPPRISRISTVRWTLLHPQHRYVERAGRNAPGSCRSAIVAMCKPSYCCNRKANDDGTNS